MSDADGLLLHLTGTGGADDDAPAHRGAKRRAAPAGGARAPVVKRSRRAEAPVPPPPSEQQQQAKQPRRVVISSLFSGTARPSAPSAPTPPPPPPAPPAAASYEFAADARSFEELGLDGRIVRLLASKMSPPITQPTPVQARGIPAILRGHDVVLDSRTGSGKTLAFVLPLVQRILALPARINRRDSGIVALILSPTRELAAQTFDVLKRILAAQILCVPGLVTGGDHRKSEKQSLRRGVNVLVATPGRLMEYVRKTRLVAFDRLAFLILDEADRMLDQGFEKDITALLDLIDEQRATAGPEAVPSGLPTRRQTILCSATVQDTLQRMLKRALTDPVFIHIEGPAPAASTAPHAVADRRFDSDSDSDEDAEDAEEQQPDEDASHAAYAFPPQLRQAYATIPVKQRLVSLVGCLMRSAGAVGTPRKGIVFFSTRLSCDFHHASLTGAGVLPDVPLFRLHSHLPSRVRTETYDEFRRCERGVLFCTDVVARGIDLPGIDFVVQFDCPQDIFDYVHRVGRTARLGAAGESVLFLIPSEGEYLDLLAAKGVAPAELPPDAFIAALPHASAADLERARVRQQGLETDAQRAATYVQTLIEQCVAKDAKLKELATQAFHQWIRSYATHGHKQRAVFHVKRIHLGHLAKSFGLLEAPSAMAPAGGGGGKHRRKKTHAAPTSA